MLNTRKPMIYILTGFIALTTILTACSPASNTESSSSETSERPLSVLGSTSVQPLMQELADAYTQNTEALIDVQGVGSTPGITGAKDGSTDIGMSSRNLKDSEKSWNLHEEVIAVDGIAVVVHPNNPIQDLPKETITKIFRGDIVNWNELGGSDEEIIVVSREAASGTRGAFDELLDLEDTVDGKTVNTLKDDALIAEGNGSVKANVAGKPNAIGYLSIGFIDDSIKTIRVDGQEPSTSNLLSGTYQISRPFILLTKDKDNKQAKDFIDFILSEEGQTIVSENYVPVR